MDSSEYFDGYDLGELEKTSSKPLVILDEWCLVALEGDDPYKAPEVRTATLHGVVTGHPLHEDGTHVTTTAPLASAGREVETQNTIYYLGEVSKDWEKWCFHNGVDVDLSNPVKVKAR